MRRCFNENVRSIVEELQGATVQPQQKAMPTPAGAKRGNPAQQVANGVQAVANQAAATGDAKIQQQMAAQQGTDPAHAAEADKLAKAQPRPAQMTPSAKARDNRNDALDGRKDAQSGKTLDADGNVSEAIKFILGEDEVDEEPAGDDATNPEEDDGMNDDEAGDRPAERAKEIFPGATDAKAAGYGKKGAGSGQCHHEITHPGQKKVSEDLFSDAERKNLLDGVFGE